MDQLHNDIRQCCNFLDSNKITERKKSCADLQDYLQKQDVLTLLNRNTENKNGMTWDTVLHSSYRGLLKEADRIRDDEAKGGKQLSRLEQSKVSFSGLISTVVSRANIGGVQRLAIGTLLQYVLNILQEAFYRRHFGCTFLQILRYHILTCHNYCSAIGQDNWEDFLSIIEQVYRNPPPRVDKALILTTLSLIMKNGGNLSFLTLEVKKKFPFIIECIKADARVLNLQPHLARLALTICQLLATESRMAICKFGEEVMPYMRNMYDIRTDGEKKDILLEWFVLQVRAHHPCGAQKGSAAAYAGQWDAWLKQLGWLYQLVIGEVTFVLRQKSTRHLRPAVVTLAMVVYKQIFERDGRELLDMSLISNIGDTSLIEGNPSKRIRLETGIPAILDKLTITSQQDMWPWLTLLSATARTYPELVSENDLVSLLQFCAEQLQTCKDTTTMDSLYRCCDTLLFVERKENSNFLDVTKLQALWNSVWETSLRTIGLNLCEEWVHQLVQKLVLNSKQVQGPVKSLLQLFISGAVHRSEHTLRTLHCLTTKYCLLEILSLQDCMTLLDWVLPNQEETPIDEWTSILICNDLIAQVVVALVVNGKALYKHSNEQLQKTDNDLEQLYLITSFEGGLCFKESDPKLLSNSNNDNELSMDSDLMTKMMTLLTRDQFVVKEKATAAIITAAAVHTLSLHISLLCNIIKTLHNSELDCDDRLKAYLYESCEVLSEAIKEFLMNQREIATTIPVLIRLRNLFELLSTVDKSIGENAVRRLSTEFFINGCSKLVTFSQLTQQPSNEFDFDELDIRPSSSAEENSPFDVECVSGRSQLQLEAYKLILEYSRWDTNLLGRLLRLPVSKKEIEIDSSCRLWMALSAGKFASSITSLPEEVLEELFDTMQSVCRQWHSSDLGVLAILDILQDMCSHVDQSEEFQVKLVTLVTGLLKFLKKKKYGPHVCCRFIKLVGHIAEVDEASRWSIYMTENGSMRPLAHLLIDFICSPFHQVRIAACQMIWTLFSPSSPRKQQVLDEIFKSVNEVFLIEGDMQVDEELDEGVLRTSTALHCLVTLIAIYSAGRSRSLLNIFILTYEKNLNTDLVIKALSVAAKHIAIETTNELITPNIPSLLWNWHEKFNSVITFPWTLLGFNTENQFFSAHIQALVPVLAHRRDSTSLQHIATALGHTIPSLLEVCFPSLIGSILPCFVDEYQQHTATVIITVVENHIGEEKVKELLNAKMGDVIANIISNLHDPEKLKTLSGVHSLDLPEPTKLSFSTKCVVGAIHYIQENSSRSGIQLMVYLSQDKPRLIQKLLLKLYTKIFQAKLPEFKLLWTHQFVSFCEMLADVVANPEYQMANYTVGWVVRMLLHLGSHPSNLALVALSFLYSFLSTVVSSHTDIINSLLPLITTSLVPLANQDTLKGRKVLEVLELLLVTHAESLPGVASIEPLPTIPMFATMTEQYQRQRYARPLSDTLMAEIQHVLNNQYGAQQTEGLKHLRTQLSEKKIELAELYKELQDSRGFSEDCQKSILHQLICMLIQTTSSPDSKARYEAACCLGELGPADLTTLVLKPETPSSSGLPLEVFLEKLLNHFQKSLFNSNVAVIQATCDALYSLFLNFPQKLIELLTDHQKELFYPFVPSTKKQRKVINIDEAALSDVLELVCPDEILSHKHWITQVVSAILNKIQLSFLVPVCSLQENLSRELLPLIIDLILHESKKRSVILDLFIAQINKFFGRHQKDVQSDEIYNNHESVISMLSVVHIIRKYVDEERKMNYLDISKAALSCSAYFTSVMFAELWISEYNRDRKDLDVEGISQLEYIEDKDTENGHILQSILREAYMKIGEPDAVYGCGSTHPSDHLAQIQHYQYEDKWSSVVETCDVQLSLNPDHQFPGLEKALHYCGLYHLAGRSSQNMSYEACWRLGQWGVSTEGDRQSYGSLVYTALQALHHSNTQRALTVVNQARTLLAESLAQTDLEAATNIYTPLSQLQALQEVEDFITQDFSLVAEKWKCQDKIGWHKFILAESIFAQRMTLLKLNPSLEQESCAKVLVNATEVAKMEGFHAVANSWLSTLSSLYSLPDHLNYSIQLLQAQIYWDKQEHYTACHILRRLLNQLRDSNLESLYARALHTYGSWVACRRTEQAQQILDKYLIPAVDFSDDDFKITSAISLARYADAEYETLLNYVKSPAYTSKIKHISESLYNAQKLSKAAEVSKKSTDITKQARIDLQKTINMHDKQSKIDQTEVENAQRELDNFLLLAVKHYMLSLEIGDVDNLSIFRVVSLWLSNYNHEDLQEELASYIGRIPSHKVLPVLPQLAARISDNTADSSTAMLHQIIERCARDHPHHVLPLVMALANSYKDIDYSPQSSFQGSSRPESRVIGAQKMLTKLKQRESLKNLVKDMQTVAESYISLANCPHNPEKTCKVYKISKSEPITKLKSLNHVLCPTVSMSVRISGDYTNIIGIQGFEETYYSVGGINVPKKITCICSDGIKRPQLVKGNDDLRQDAVMQQVFTIMNSLLHENKDTRKRRLLIRTYKVVPLSQRSGVIEWCINTQPLATYLVGGGGVVSAHTRYRKKDWTPAVCRQKMSDAAKHNNKKKLAIFKEICANFKPVFRHFFFENFSNPGIWYERKLAYTHSVATSSMVGYILGLGDRHIMNILIDERTAEVIHIDFGIAFEQGRTLVTAETVPFRLTRDIIDGMGVSGIEGVFRRSCEKTMVVLRECKSTILTILEVLLYDPLYMWTITPAKAMARQPSNEPLSEPSQDSEEGEVNKLAERALLRLKQKLQGIEEGSTTSVEGQVSKLIQEATNPANLCRLFHGWQAYV